VNNELERIWKELLVAQLEVLTLHLKRVTKESLGDMSESLAKFESGTSRIQIRSVTA
jgi:hypothetical protein